MSLIWTPGLVSVSPSRYPLLCLTPAHVADYRRIPRALSNVYHHPLSKEVKDEVNKIFTALATNDGDQEPIQLNRTLPIWGRTLNVPESSASVAKFTFHDLCGKPLSAADYLEVTKTFRTVFVMDVPKMNMGQKDLVSITLSGVVGRTSRCVPMTGQAFHHIH